VSGATGRDATGRDEERRGLEGSAAEASVDGSGQEDQRGWHGMMRMWK
jgi:hypothetical protein